MPAPTTTSWSSPAPTSCTASAGGGTGSLDETIRRGVAYAEAGADVFLPTGANAEQVAQIKAEVSIPIACYGTLMEGVAFALATGWGTASAARLHRRWATHLLEHGELPQEAFEFPGKTEAIQQVEYDVVIEAWAKATGRPIRPPAD
jgi:2-methylisocitrate lyase-like PEP mutase family enzyme